METKTIDSLKYNPKHTNTKSIEIELNRLSEDLSRIGYIDNIAGPPIQINDSSYLAKIHLGEKIKAIHIYIGSNKKPNLPILLKEEEDTIILPYPEIDFYLRKKIQELEQNGFALAKLKLTNIKRINAVLYANLKIETDKKRILNAITINYEDTNSTTKFPSGHFAQLNRKYKTSIFNQKVLDQIYTDFENFGFISQIKYPEILFTKDTTKVYVYLQKRKSNTFDGFIGFTNNENQKITLNGYLDVQLQNILGTGEQLSVYWKSDGNDQKTFKASVELPYLLKTPIGLKAQIQLFRQDTTFQNTKTAIDLSYFINYNTRFYLGYQKTESSAIQNLNNNPISDFNNSFLTSSFNYIKLDAANSVFPTKSSLTLQSGIGSRALNTLSENTTKSNQFFINIQAVHNFNLNKKNSIHINSLNYYLQSNTYVTNELHRFGGFNSVRGFAENSLQAYLMTSLLTEYRYIVSPNLYVHSILDYSIYKDKSPIDQQDKKENLIGIGMGLGLLTKNGLFKLALASGSTTNQPIEINNTIVHISYNVTF
ncbi:outer membrane protein assembly factor [Flavobacterium sp. LS1R10]|uniref:outer membrane protein assembly factor n=1 Tax=Flavobacterium sp. LS1R10 TaxID=2497482 RepID=UPI001F1AC1B4|nr:outer membrane protein assembly factor [Flavobacterium sp. LS1R10]